MSAVLPLILFHFIPLWIAHLSVRFFSFIIPSPRLDYMRRSLFAYLIFRIFSISLRAVVDT